MSLPQPANYLGLWYTAQDSQATGLVPSNQIILRKKAGDNTLYLETDAGEEEIMTSSSAATYSQVTITGDAVDALLVQNAAETAQILTVDTLAGQVDIAGRMSIQGDISLTGTLSTTTSNVLQFDDSLIKLSVDQTATDTTNQGWYATYSPDGIAVNYRGLIFDRAAGQFRVFNGAATEPDENSAIPLSGNLASGSGQLINMANQIYLGQPGFSITIDAKLPAGTDYIYTIQNAGPNATFLLDPNNALITGQYTYTDLLLANTVDQTKRLDFNVSNVSTATTLSMALPDYNSILAGNIGTNNFVLGRTAYSTITTAYDNTFISSTAGQSATSAYQNVSIGQLTLESLTGGDEIVAAGYHAARNFVGVNSVAIGSYALRNGGLSGSGSIVSIGHNSIIGSTTGSWPVAIGTGALGNAAFNASFGVAIGKSAGFGTTTSSGISIGNETQFTSGSVDNVAIGHQALRTNAGTTSVAIGTLALGAVNGGTGRVAIGHEALRYATGTRNRLIAIGSYAISNAAYAANENIAIGTNAGRLLSNSILNVVVGHDALSSATTTGQTIAIGYHAAYNSTTGGLNNVAIGYEALGEAKVGITSSMAIGSYALRGTTLNNQTGNIAIGNYALSSAAYNSANNMAIGNDSMLAMETGSGNVAIGERALAASPTAFESVAVGYEAMAAATGVIEYNVALGAFAMRDIQNVQRSVAIGGEALRYAANCTDNVAIGYQSLGGASLTGSNNICMGNYAGRSITTGAANVCVGSRSGELITTGSNNVLVGERSGDNITIGSNNICIGHEAEPEFADDDNWLVIGDAVFEAATVSNAAAWAQTKNLLVRVGGTTYYLPLSTTA